jgi:Cu(I)/Ag(I) efflux system membrane fusion protein
VPKKDWMGMDYIAVYEGEDEDDGDATVKVSLDKVQRAGVRTEQARMVALAKPVHAPGIAKPDERTLRVITLRADAFIETLYVNEKGRHVKAGEPLFRLYSPDFLRALVEAKSSSIAGVIGAEQKLQILGIPPDAIAEAKRSKEVVPSFDYPSPASGVVMEKLVVEGMMMRMGEPLYRLVDLSSIWVIASVAEQDLAGIRIGDPAKVRFKALPGETFDGKATFILHELASETRTASVRIEIKNPDHRIKHEMYADVEIDAGAADPPRLAVSEQAVIDSGNRQVVLIARGEGRFEPRAVTLGRRGDGMIEIASGLEEGETIVVSANFLIDAESNLKAALAAFTADAPQPMPDASKEPAR